MGMSNTGDLLETVKKEFLDDSRLPLRETALNPVFGRGNPHAKILFIGEAPGEEEDKQGLPFVGAAGRELSKLLASVGLSDNEAYIANILKYRPPNNREPSVSEIESHTPYLLRQIAAIKPKIICTLGNYATKFILAKGNIGEMKNIQGITKLHGASKTVILEGLSYQVIPLYHPAAMLYNPPLRKILEDDFKIVAQEIQGRNEIQKTLSF
ncbi:uracil-DNA glycosylase [Candidatus Woesearchaeota archaeon]|nr:uracil-DNA glycosylase [Candidatus Woesearchaeota archaeon]